MPVPSKPLRLLVASSNEGKLSEYRALAAPCGESVELSLIPNFDRLPQFEETAPTFGENAVGKAIYYSRFSDGLVLSDDSGLVVPALGGAPGVHSARYAGPGATDADRIHKLLGQMRGMEGNQRVARFVCVLALAERGEVRGIFSAVAEGEILDAPEGDGGFGYDPIFFLPVLGKSYASISREEKNRYSHRGQAFRKALEFLRPRDRPRFRRHPACDIFLHRAPMKTLGTKSTNSKKLNSSSNKHKKTISKGAAGNSKLKGANPARMRTILEKLDEAYPDVQCALVHANPFQLLISTILSAQCTDVRVNEVTKTLYQKYRTPQDFAYANPAEIERDIRPTGFFRNKTKSILGASKKIVEEFNGEVPRTMEQLLTLPGVARKTANVVLGTAYGIADGVVVDTHVIRLSRRLDLTHHSEPKKIETDLMAIIPRDKWILFSHQLIWHGRKVCQARNPRCAECNLEPVCYSKDKTV